MLNTRSCSCCWRDVFSCSEEESFCWNKSASFCLLSNSKFSSLIYKNAENTVINSNDANVFWCTVTCHNASCLDGFKGVNGPFCLVMEVRLIPRSQPGEFSAEDANQTPPFPAPWFWSARTPWPPTVGHKTSSTA